MSNFDLQKIKKEIIMIDPKKWWGDDFDVRFYLISKMRNIQNKKILDIGGGIGIILSQLNKNNERINMDISFKDLIMCKKNNGKKIQNICGSMTQLPFKENIFDCVIAANILEVAKENDLKNYKTSRDDKNSISKTIDEIHKVIKNEGNVFLTTPNNEYYKTNKLTYEELKNSLTPFFIDCKITFYNTYPKLHNKYRKLNMANVIPKLLAKIRKNESIINSLLKTKNQNNYSVSFFVELKNKVV